MAGVPSKYGRTPKWWLAPGSAQAPLRGGGHDPALRLTIRDKYYLHSRDQASSQEMDHRHKLRRSLACDNLG